jgi:uncharacterized protein (AIM24 family)
VNHDRVSETHPRLIAAMGDNAPPIPAAYVTRFRQGETVPGGVARYRVPNEALMCCQALRHAALGEAVVLALETIGGVAAALSTGGNRMKLQCQQCGFGREVPQKYAGKTVKCPQCGQPVALPAEPAHPQAAPPPVAPSPAAPVSASPSAAPTPSEAVDNPPRYSIAQFIRRSAQRDHGHGVFEMESDRLLEINLKGRVWIKTGAMVAYRGEIKFTREGILEHGIGRMLKKAVSGEGARLTKADGQGALYLADVGKKVTILELQGESIFVNGNDLLAFEEQIQWDIRLMRKVAGMMAGGLFNVRLEGHGLIAITTHYDPMTLQVTPGRPVFTDPNATVAWDGSLQPDIKTDISFKTFLGRGSGESIQMRFDGQGFVVIQPYEEVYFQSSG